jgi:hypothetical protein
VYDRNLEEYPQPLYYASLLGYQACIEKLLEEGAEVMAEGGTHKNSLIAAVFTATQESFGDC